MKIPLRRRGSKRRLNRGYAPGADGIYGPVTQRAINLLRKSDPSAPKRQRRLGDSINALIAFLQTKKAHIGRVGYSKSGKRVIEDPTLSQTDLGYDDPDELDV